MNYVVKNWKFDKSKLSKYELQDYELAVQKLQQWEQLNAFMTEVRHFVREIRQVIGLRRMSNHPSQLEMRGYPEFEEEIMKKYFKLLSDLEEFPEWKAKVEAEVAPVIKLLADHTRIRAWDGEEFNEFNFHKHFR